MYVYMFLKQEMEDFERKKIVVSKVKILIIMYDIIYKIIYTYMYMILLKMFLMDTLAKISQNIFAYSFV